MDAQLRENSTTFCFPQDQYRVYIEPCRKFTVEEFDAFCRDNRNLRFEMSKGGEISVMPPVHSDTSEKNSEIGYQLRHWGKKDKTGKVYESSAGFVLPNGAIRSPDACWIAKERLENLSEFERKGFMNICPDFVIELRSASDSLPKLKAKMSEYIESGAKLGWLIDPANRKVHIYRQNDKAEILENPRTVTGEDILKDFELDLSEIL